MRTDRKKAQGEIITTILIILLVLAVVVIVWQVIKGTVEKGAEEIEQKTPCIGLDLSIASASRTGNDITVKVTRGTDAVGKGELIVKATGTGDSVDATTTPEIEALDSVTIKVSDATLATGDVIITTGIKLASGSLCQGPTTTETAAELAEAAA